MEPAGRPLADLVAAVAGDEVEVAGRPDTLVRSLAAHHADCRPGSLFFALRGARDDGVRHVEKAVRSGAVAVVHARDARPALPPGTVRVTVADVRRAKARIASRFFGDPWRAVPVVGVTGTNGKTTTTWLLASIGEAASGVFARVGTVEHRVGSEVHEAANTTPDPIEIQRWLARARQAGAALFALEVSSQGLVQKRTEGIAFRGAVFTNLSPEHLDAHGTLAAYFEAKASLFRSLTAEAFAVVPHGDPWGARIARIARTCAARVLRVGPTRGADACWRVRSSSARGSRFDLIGPWGRIEGLETPMLGVVNVENAALAASAALLLGFDEDRVRLGLARAKRLPGRLEPVEGPASAPRVYVDYAHTDQALARAIEALRPLVAGRLVIVFGCGGDRDRGKRPRMGRVAARLSDRVYVTSDNPRSEDPERIVADVMEGVPAALRDRVEAIVDRATAIRTAILRAGPDDVVLVAGKGHEREQIVGGRRVAFDDRRVAEEALWSRS